MRLLKSNRFVLTTTFLLVLLQITVFGQVPNHTYPRIAIWQWEGALSDWYARFDLAYTRIGSTGGDRFIDEVKSKNPNIIWLPTEDFNCAHTFFPNFPNEWYVIDSKGNRLNISYCDGMANLSDVGPRVNGQLFIDALPKYLARLVSESGSNGYATDGLYSTAHYAWATPEDVDLDRNGVNDMVEHGKSWFLSHWGNGVELLLSRLRSELGNGKVIMLNTGSSDTPGRSVVNGYVREYGGGITDWNAKREYETRLSREVFQPPIFLLQAAPDKGRDPRATDPSKNDLTFMRYSLVQSMLFGMYYSFEHVDGKSSDHYWNNYFDEFDLDLGYPTGNMQRVKDEVWARFFDGGVAMANFSGRDVTFSDQDLRPLSGYQGPYHHFLGGQDMALHGSNAMNNGQRFTSVTLIGYTYLAYHDNATTMGDGVILVKTPQNVVSDIIIEESEAGTSPTNEPTVLSGAFTLQDCGAGTNYYEIRCSWNRGTYSFAIATPGGGEAKFIPSIGVTGKYEAFEWHGRMNSGSLASHVTYIVTHAGGRTSKIVNQQVNVGQWNSLGVYTFNKGKLGNVTISSAGANGPVMADAVKFVFRDGNSKRDTTAPAPPQNVNVKQGN